MSAQNEIVRFVAKGEDASDAFKQLQKSLDSDTKALKESTKGRWRRKAVLRRWPVALSPRGNRSKQISKDGAIFSEI